MKISARNILKGAVVAVAEGAVNGVVSIKIGDDVVKTDITMEAIKSLGLAEGVEAFAIVKASSVMFAAGSEKIAGTVVEVTEGAVNGHVVIETASGARIKGSITNEAIEALGLAQGAPAIAVVKSTDVMVGVE